VGLDPEKAEQGLRLSNLDGDDHTTEVLAEELGIDVPPPPDEGREAA
jgi:hypothetical protein